MSQPPEHSLHGVSGHCDIVHDVNLHGNDGGVPNNHVPERVARAARSTEWTHRIGSVIWLQVSGFFGLRAIGQKGPGIRSFRFTLDPEPKTHNPINPKPVLNPESRQPVYPIAPGHKP